MLGTSTPARADKLVYDTSSSTLPSVEKIVYKFSWLGIRFGRARLNWSETDTNYKASVVIKASGIARMFDKQTRTITIEGLVKKEDGQKTYIPQKSTSKVVRPKKQRTVEIIYDAEGKVTKSTVTPPDDRRFRPEVEQAKMDSAFDHFTAALSIHQQAKKKKKQSHTIIYDGRRLTKAILTQVALNQNEKENWEPLKNPIQQVARRVLMGGYTDKERRRYYEGEPMVMSISSPETSRFPFYVYANTSFGRVIGYRDVVENKQASK